MTFILLLIATILLKIYGMLLKGRCVVLSMVNKIGKLQFYYEMILSKLLMKENNCLITYLRYLHVINDLKKCGEWKQYGTLMRQTKNLMDINIDALYNILKQNQGDVNDAMGYKKKAVVSEGSDDEDIIDLKNITALLVKAFNRKKYYVKPTNNNLITSSASSSANKKPEISKTLFEEKNNEFNEQIKVLSETNVDLLAQTKVLQEQLKVKHVVIDTHTECQTQYAKLEEERYQYMIRYSALCDNDKQHRKKIDEQEILFDKMSRQLVEMNNNVLRLQEKILEKETKISELEECVRNKDLEIEKCLERLNDCENKLHKIGQTRQTIHMIMPSKDKMYNGRKGIGFENPSYFCKAKDLRPSLYDERVIGLGLYASYDVNDLFVFDDVSIRNSRVSKMPFRKKPHLSLDSSSIRMFKSYDKYRVLLTNYCEMFLGTVRFGIMILQFFDKGLEVAFRKSTCFVRNKDGVDLLTGDRSSNLYTIALNEIASNSSACSFPKMKFEKDHLCSACEQGKIHRKHHKSKTAFTSNKPLYLLHMDLCGPMRVESINEKRYVLVVVDDYSRCYLLSDYDDVVGFKRRQKGTLEESPPIDFNDHFSKTKDFKKDLTISFDSSESSILPFPLLDSDSPFTAELSASITLNSLGNKDKVFKPGILVYHAIHDKNLATLEENLKENISSGTLLIFKEPSFLLPPPEPPDECLKNVVLNFYQSKKMIPLHVEDVNSFTFIIWTFLPYFPYTKPSPLIFSFRSENFCV
ncbi:retrovirus-related pol polyprotein from transposon TNT 1-94 [Tanacetum coccineum]